MSFSTSRDDDVMCDINVTPLVDVMLVLLVTFIVTAPLLNNAIPLDLPQTVATTSLDQSSPVVLSVDVSGRVFIDAQAVSLEQLPDALQALRDKDPDVAVSLRADQATGYGQVAQVLADVQKAGIRRVAVITESP
jgi:biopolymer transport protein ExbD